MQSGWLGDSRRDIEELKARVHKLEKSLADGGIPGEEWFENLRLETPDVTCKGKMKKVGNGLVITVHPLYWKNNLVFDNDNAEGDDVVERCAVIRMMFPSNDLAIQADRHWMEYHDVRAMEPYMLMRRTAWRKAGDGQYKLKQRVGRFRGGEGVTQGVVDAMCRKVDSSIDSAGDAMLCKLCRSKKGDYLRLYLSKGWSDYFLMKQDCYECEGKGTVEDEDGEEIDCDKCDKGKIGSKAFDESVEVHVDICSLVNSDRLDGLNIPMRCRYQRIDDERGKSIRVKLPSWFKTIRGGALLERPEFTCKILHAYQTNKSNTLTMKVHPNSTQIKPQAVVFKKIKDRAELRYPMMHNIDEQLPLGKGFLDLQLRL